MIYNLYATQESIDEIEEGKKGIAFAQRYVNVEHISISLDTKEYIIKKEKGKDLFIIEKKFSVMNKDKLINWLEGIHEDSTSKASQSGSTFMEGFHLGRVNLSDEVISLLAEEF